MRGRNLLIFTCVTLVLVAVGIVASARLLLARFGSIEKQTTRNEATQVQRGFTADLRQLDLSARDYAEWDDAEAFTHSRDPAFLKTNFNRDSLEGMHADLVWLMTPGGEDVYSAQLDPRTGAVAEPASPPLLTQLRQQLSVVRQHQLLPPGERLVSTAIGVLALSVFEIRRSDKSAPTGMLMLFGRFIRPDVLQRVADATALNVRMIELRQRHSSGAELPQAVRTWMAHPKADAEPLPVVIDEHVIDGYVELKDIDGRSALLLVTRLPRDIHALGVRSTWTLVGAIIALITLSMLAILAVLLRARQNWKARMAAEKRYRQIVASVQEAILLVDASSGQIIDTNEALQQLCGYSAEELRGRPVAEILPRAAAGGVDLQHALTPTGSQESAIRTRAGGRREAEISVSVIEEQYRRLLCLVARDITPRKEAERAQHEHRRQLSHIAHHDPLTGLPNRLYLQSRLPRVLRKVAGGNRLLALMYVDVDNFKNINDSLGHGSGDQVLSVVAKRLRACTRSSDVVVRMGGDEFVVVATLLQDRAAVEVIASKIVAAMRAPIALNDRTVQVSASIGISLFPEDGIDVESLLKHADIALYQAKEQGRDNHQFFRADMDVQLSEHVALEQALRHALDTTQLYLEYQPIVNIDTLTVTSFEALCRWKHPELGPVPPTRFIAVAEKSGLIVQLGEYVLREACWQLRRWKADGVRLVPIGVNVSPLQLARTDFAALVRQMTQEAEIDPKLLYFEITESALLAEADRHVATLEELRRMGCRIAIDDFGAGYSTFSYLKRLPVDTLKIDSSFIRELSSSAADAAVVRGIIDMARGMGMATVAEGVETAMQLVMLRDMGCTNAQGYRFSPAVSARRCRALLNAMGTQRRWSDTLMTRAMENTLTSAVIARPAAAN